MNIKKITAEEFIRSKFSEGEFDEIMEFLNTSIEPSIKVAMIEFAKFHVKEALNAAHNSLYDNRYSSEPSINEDCYPLTNIK